MHVFEQNEELEAKYKALVLKENRLNEKLVQFDKARERLYRKRRILLAEQENFLVKANKQAILEAQLKERERLIQELKSANLLLKNELSDKLGNQTEWLTKINKRLVVLGKNKSDAPIEKDSFWNKLLWIIPSIVALGYIWWTNKDKKSPIEVKKEMEEFLKDS